VTAPVDTLALARAECRELSLYASASSECVVDLSDNTNLWGMPPAALRALRDAPPTVFSRYPSAYSEPLQEDILRYLGMQGVAGLRVVAGCGSDDVIDSTMRAFGMPGDRIVFAAPTFSMVPVFARLNGLTVVPIPFNADFEIDADRLVDCDAKITYLCSPNNPTATALSRATVEYVAANARGIVLLDEAYAEFAPESFVDLVGRYERLVVVRTFSKAFGLAGLRVGYGVGSETLMELIERARGPYKVNAMAERAVLAALNETPDGLPWVRAHVTLAVEVRERFTDALGHLGLAPFPSAANFVLVPTPRASALAGGLADRGVLVRSLSGLPREVPSFADSEGAALRIGVGPWEQMQMLLAALEEVLACE
jgi:histidinol-phosphate aminotransferase